MKRLNINHFVKFLISVKFEIVATTHLFKFILLLVKGSQNETVNFLSSTSILFDLNLRNFGRTYST